MPPTVWLEVKFALSINYRLFGDKARIWMNVESLLLQQEVHLNKYAPVPSAPRLLVFCYLFGSWPRLSRLTPSRYYSCPMSAPYRYRTPLSFQSLKSTDKKMPTQWILRLLIRWLTTTVVAADSSTADSVTATIVPTADSVSTTVVAADSSTADPPMATSTDNPSLTTPTATDSPVTSNSTDKLPPTSAGDTVNLKLTVGILAVGFLFIVLTLLWSKEGGCFIRMNLSRNRSDEHSSSSKQLHTTNLS